MDEIFYQVIRTNVEENKYEFLTWAIDFNPCQKPLIISAILI